MSKPPESAYLAEQIEIARRSIEGWPEWFKDAAGVGGTQRVEPASGQQLSQDKNSETVADLAD